MHYRCRNAVYPLSNVTRLLVEDSQVPWGNSFENYNPPFYESKNLQNKPWADLPIEDKSFKPKWNCLDNKVNRKSHTNNYEIIDNKPQNFMGRTGLSGRGLLGRWGPNHAADPIITRWKMDNSSKVLDPISKLAILQFCAILRHDCNEWAIPGGMVDPGENISQTLKREFLEEALNHLQKSSVEKEDNERVINELFVNGKEVYKGYVDDPRNTDNAWMETVAVNFHDDTGNTFGKFNLQAGDDAKNVRWMDISRKISLYASHLDFLESVCSIRNAHF